MGEPNRGEAMARICWWSVDIMSRMLTPDERDAVRGDFAESGETGGQALRDVLGLVVRRQAALWKDWRPWLTLVAVVVPAGMLLSLFSRFVADDSATYIWLYVNNWTWGYLAPGFRSDIVGYITGIFMEYLLLGCWSWTTGLVLGVPSRRFIWINGSLFCFLLLLGEFPGSFGIHFAGNDGPFSLTFYRVIFPMILQTALVLFPSIWGIHRSFKLASLPLLLQTMLWPAAAAAVLMATQVVGFWWWPLRFTWTIPMLRFGALLPVTYILASEIRQRCHRVLKENRT